VNAGPRRPGLLVPGALALVGLLILLGLGSWQIERKAWKEALIATLARRATAPPVDLPPASSWSTLTPDNAEFTRVRLRAEFRGAAPAYVYTSGSSLRDDVKGAGYFVFEPARLSDGRQVVINRGFVPTWTFPQARGPQDIVGAIRFPEQPSWLFPAHSGVGETWTVRDTEGMAALRGWGAVAPFYIEQEAPVPPGGLPHPAPLKARLRNDHLQYAITWYGLAAVLAVMFAIWAVKRRREQRG
jgi:cytochrome oxidase assembly protein ShyY1